MKQIELSQGKFTLVDDEDYDFLMQWNWVVAAAQGNRFYAIRSIKKTHTTVIMHRVIMKPETSDMIIDHINGDGLDNRRQNLRICTVAENVRNRRKKSNSPHLYKGISKSGNRWQAAIVMEGKSIYLGGYDTQERAALAYNEGALKYHGEFAHINIVPPSLIKPPVWKYSNNTSGFRGVCYSKGKWVARLMLNRKDETLGYFDTPEEAARAYDAKARELHGDKAKLNFPDYSGQQPLVSM